MHHGCDANGTWQDVRDEALVQSRLARALAAVTVSELPIRLRLAAAEWWGRLLPRADHAPTPVSAAHWLIALASLQGANPGKDLRRAAQLARYVKACYEASHSSEWEWFETTWTAGAAVIPALCGMRR